MIQIWKITFYRINTVYSKLIAEKTNTLPFVSLVLGLIIYSHIFVGVNVISLLIFSEIWLPYPSFAWIITGNIVVFSVYFFLKRKRLYRQIIRESEILLAVPGNRLIIGSNLYLVLSGLALGLFFFL
jgi:general stress protein CsbA